MRRILVLTLVACPGLAAAAVEDVLSQHILPYVASFADATQALAEAAEEDCTAEVLREPYAAVWHAWAPISDLRIGPSESAALSISFWPDERGAGGKAIRSLLAEGGPALTDPAAFAEVSAAARGLAGLDLLLFDPELSAYNSGEPGCLLVQTATADLAAQAQALAEAWPEEAQALLTAGGEGNARYLTDEEAVRALYTQVLSSLEFTADTRLGRPLGEPDRPRPTRAEFWRSGRPLPNALAAAEGAVQLVTLLTDEALPATAAALDQVRRAAAAIEDPYFQVIEDPQAGLKVEILQDRLRALLDAIEAEVGTPLGLQPGFNSQDGD